MRINGAGCSLIDSIYMHSSYDDESFSALWSKQRGDGGLIEGGLVFSEDLEKFSHKNHQEILASLTKGRQPDVVNLGGPAVVAMVHAAQLLAEERVQVTFHGAIGIDEFAQTMRSTIENTPLHHSFKIVKNKPTATTEVFDDPSRRNGKGERSFVNTIGAAGEFGPEDLPDSFYDADIILLGGTALVPRLHDGLHTVLKKAKERGCITVVGTVYDFRNEKRNPDKPWPLGDQSSYENIDLLIVDQEEALKLTGAEDILIAAERLIAFGVGAFIITRGALDMLVWSNGPLIRPYRLGHLPVSDYIDDLMAKDPYLRKDTTGCGDNFVGGVLVSLAKQMKRGVDEGIDMVDLCAWGAASGGFTCTYHGGTFHEKEPGEKAKLLEPVVQAYKETTGA